jgi:hypothetical protein
MGLPYPGDLKKLRATSFVKAEQKTLAIAGRSGFQPFLVAAGMRSELLPALSEK